MIHIAILEDDAEDRKAVLGALKKYEKEHDVVFKTSEFSNAITFLTNYNPIYNIVFMDIEMPHMNGMEAAAKLREIDVSVPLVFITNMSNFAVKGYSVNAVDFIVKPLQYQSFAAMMDKVLRLIKSTEESIILKGQDGKVRVPLNSISFIEVLDHQLCFHTDSGDISVWGSLKEQEETLPQDRFIKCNNYCIVNLRYVDSISDNDLIVKGENVSVSRSKKKEVMQRLLAFYGKYV